MLNKRRIADIQLIIAAIVWGSSPFIIKDSVGSISPIALVGYRLLLASLVLGIVLLIMKKNPFKAFKRGMWLGIIYLFSYIAQAIGLIYTSSANSGFIAGLFIMFIPLFYFLISKNKPSKKDIITTVVAMSGLWILTGGIEHINYGDLLTLVTALTVGLYTVVSEKLLKEEIHPLILVFHQFVVVGTVSTIISFVMNGFVFVELNGTLPAIAYLAVFPGILSNILITNAQKYVSSDRVGIIISFQSVAAAVLAWTLGGEKLVLSGAIGGSIMLLAMFISTIPDSVFLSAKQYLFKVINIPRVRVGRY